MNLLTGGNLADLREILGQLMKYQVKVNSGFD